MQVMKGHGKGGSPPPPKQAGKVSGKGGGYLAKAAARKKSCEVASVSVVAPLRREDAQNSSHSMLVPEGSSPPGAIVVSGIESEPGLNGTYEENGKFHGERTQWMKPNSRCYVRWIRGRWEIYVSHHPAGTTYFYTSDIDTECPPAKGWIPTECAMPSETPMLSLAAVGTRSNNHLLMSRPLRLWCNRTCPFVQRVRVALKEKGIQDAVEEIEVDVLGDKDPFFVDMYRKTLPNSSHRRPAVPMLEHHSLESQQMKNRNDNDAQASGDSVVVIESKVIVEYLDEVSSSIELTQAQEAQAVKSSLLPASAAKRATARLFIDIFEREISPCIHTILNATDMEALRAAVEILQRGLHAVEGFLAAHAGRAGPFLCDEHFALPEVLLAPDLLRLLTLSPHFRPQLSKLLPCRRGTKLDADISKLGPLGLPLAERAPRFARWAAAVLERPSVAETYWLEETIAIKQRAVPAWRGDDLKEAGASVPYLL